MRFTSSALSLSVLAVMGMISPQTIHAADLTYAISAPATSTDPHYQNASQNNAALRNLYQTLVQIDASGQMIPDLAESWRAVDDRTWEFKIHPAKFHDGSDLTVEDIIYSLDRPATITNSPSSFTIYTKAIVDKQIVDKNTIRLITATPYPLLPLDLTNIFVVKKSAVEKLTTADLNAGRGVVGSGPFSFVSFTPDDKLVLRRSEHYSGPKPDWDNVTVRFVPNDGARTTALLSGSVDAIENVPTPDIEKIKANPDLVFASKKSQRVVFLFLDSGRDKPPGITGVDGKPLAANPLKDARVRQAINLAIDRQAIRDRVMQQLAYPTNNIVFDGGEGFLPKYENVPVDATKAKRLLAEAGYPDGFQLTIAAPNNRLINDEKVVQVIAQMLTRIGIKTQVDAMPFAVINTRGGKGEFAASMMAWGTTTEGSIPIRALLACANAEKGWGPVNWGNYCNPKLDELLAQAVSTVDTPRRKALLEQAVEIVLDDMALVPLYFQGSTWAARKGIKIIPRSDERTMPSSFQPTS
jgi:peptide/nickel transport system substrate-binding protein